MHSSEVKVKLLDDRNRYGNKVNRYRLCFIIAICVTSSIAVSTYLAWNELYQESLKLPPNLGDIPLWYIKRSERLKQTETLIISESDTQNRNEVLSKNSQHKSLNENTEKKLVCYYSYPGANDSSHNLYLKNVDPHLCTHLNVGIINIVYNRLFINDHIKKLLNEAKELKEKNKNLKILLWVGGADSKGFPEMVSTHANRKMFISSLRNTLKMYHLDGVDLDWEFPTAYRKERQHLSQLLHEIRKEYEREHRKYLLSVAVAAPEGIAFFAYDIREINLYTDYVNIMTYDYHFYSKSSPFTGLNAPLYVRHAEHSLLATLNINYTVNYWLSHGLERNKIIVGLPTYGHSFKLVNPFNNGIGSPAQGFGRVGTLGFASYSEVCWFKENNLYVTTVYDTETCSPYLYSGTEWISYEDERSLECKARYIKSNGFGGAMIFSLNTDDYGSHCEIGKNKAEKNASTNSSFPLVRKIYSVLFDKE